MIPLAGSESQRSEWERDFRSPTLQCHAVLDTRGTRASWQHAGLSLTSTVPTSYRSLRCLRFGGRYGVVGWTSTPYAGGGRAAGAVQTTANTLPTNLIMLKAAKVFGCPVAIATKHDPSIRPPRLAALDAWIACGFIRPLVSHRSTLENCGEALLQKWQRKVTGGAVVHPE